MKAKGGYLNEGQRISGGKGATASDVAENDQSTMSHVHENAIKNLFLAMGRWLWGLVPNTHIVANNHL